MTGEELRRQRTKRLRMSQSQLGEAIGLDKNTIARMERGERSIKRTTELAVKYLLLTMKSKIKGRAKK